MSRIITSPVPAFAGTVTLPDHLTMSQVLAWEDAAINGRKSRIEVAKKIAQATAELHKDKPVAEGEAGDAEESVDLTSLGITDAKIEQLYINAICSVVEKWELKGFPKDVTPDNFPGTPRVASSLLFKWLTEEIAKVYLGETDVPNE